MSEKTAIIIEFTLVLALILVAASGCGYRAREAGRPVGMEIASIAIPIIECDTSVPGFESDVTRLLREEFIGHSRIPLVPERDAHTVLRTRATRIETRPVSYDVLQTMVGGETTDYETTSVRRLNVFFQARLIERKSGAVLWEEGLMREQALYKVSSDPLVTRNNMRKAIRDIAEGLSQRIFARTMERF